MSIKSSVFYNKHTGHYEGYTDLGKDIVSDEDEIAKEALVFMLVSYRGQWKYPVKINAAMLHRLLSQALDLCKSNNLDVRTITCDGTATTFNAMMLSGCKIGKSLNEINGQFKYPGFEYDLYFTPDPPQC